MTVNTATLNTIQKQVCEVSDQASDGLHQLFKQHSNVLIAEKF